MNHLRNFLPQASIWWNRGANIRLAFCAMMLPAALFLHAGKVVLVTGDWDPYTNEKVAGKGAFTELVTAVFDEMKVEYEVQFYPWKRVEAAVADGTAYAAFPYVITDERKQFFDFSDEVMVSNGKFFYYKPNNSVKFADWKTYDDLKSVKIGGVLGYWYEKDFKAAGLNVDYVPTDEQNFKKLEAGRVDLVPTDELVGRALIKTLFPDKQKNFLVLPKPLNSSSLYLMVSKKYNDAEALTKKFNDSLKAIRKSGKYAKILSKHGIK